MIKVLVYTGCFLAIVTISLYGINKLYQYGWTGGFNTSESGWKQAAIEAKDDKLHAVQTLRDSLRSVSLDLADALDTIEAQELEEEKNVEHGKDMLLDAIYSGRIKLHLPTKARSNVGPDSGGSENEGDTTVAKGRCAGEATGELPVAATAFLYGESDRANKLVRDYNYLVDYTKLIRAECGAR